MDPFCYLCFVCVMLSCLSIAALQPCGHLLGKVWPLGSLVCDIFVLLSQSHVVSWVRCGT